jgi:hypothetical protein
MFDPACCMSSLLPSTLLPNLRPLTRTSHTTIYDWLRDDEKTIKPIVKARSYGDFTGCA